MGLPVIGLDDRIVGVVVCVVATGWGYGNTELDDCIVGVVVCEVGTGLGGYGNTEVDDCGIGAGNGGAYPYCDWYWIGYPLDVEVMGEERGTRGTMDEKP